MVPSDRFCRVYHLINELPENLFLYFTKGHPKMFDALLVPVILCQLIWSLGMLPYTLIHYIYDEIQWNSTKRHSFSCYTGYPI